MHEMSERSKRNTLLRIWPAFAVIFLDQISKLAVMNGLRVHESVPIISGLFNLVHVRNRGMAFGFLNRPDLELGFYFLVGASLVAIVFLLYLIFHMRQEDGLSVLPLYLILGGAVGNLIDRLRYREVIDFLDFYIGPYHWPAFNVADSAITVGACLIAINIFIRHKHF